MKLDAESLERQALLCRERAKECDEHANSLRARISGQGDEWRKWAHRWQSEADSWLALKGEVGQILAAVGDTQKELSALKKMVEISATELVTLRGKLLQYEKVVYPAEMVEAIASSPVRVRPARVAEILAGVG